MPVFVKCLANNHLRQSSTACEAMYYDTRQSEKDVFFADGMTGIQGKPPAVAIDLHGNRNQYIDCIYRFPECGKPHPGMAISRNPRQSGRKESEETLDPSTQNIRFYGVCNLDSSVFE